METFLVFPPDSRLRAVEGLHHLPRIERRVPLLILPAVWPGTVEILIFQSGRVFTGSEFRALRLASGIWIETSQVLRVKQILKLPMNEPGVFTTSLRGEGG